MRDGRGAPVIGLGPIVVVFVSTVARHVRLEFKEGLGAHRGAAVIHVLLASREVVGMYVWDYSMWGTASAGRDGDVVDISGDVWFSNLVMEEVDGLLLQGNRTAQFHHPLEIRLKAVVEGALALMRE